MTGGLYHRLTGGAGRDKLTGATTMEGGKGADTMIGSAQGTTFVLNQGDFARGEIIRGDGLFDTLSIVGDMDIRGGAVTGIEAIAFVFEQLPSGTLYANASQLQGVRSIGLGILDVTMARGDLFLPRLSESNNCSIDVTGSAGADVIRSNGLRNVRGGGGNDTIFSGSYSSRVAINGDEGDDNITTWLDGTGTVNGGDGNDTLSLISGYIDSTGMVINLSRSADQISVSDLATIDVANFENINLSHVYFSNPNAVISITGNAGANVLTGLLAPQGEVTMLGLDGDDRLVAGNASNFLFGGDGDDILCGNDGIDRVTGGAGADIFQFRYVSPTFFDINGNSGDVIRDFDIKNDMLQFDRTVFDFSGQKFDNRVVSDGDGSVAGADLVIATGAPLSTEQDVVNFLSSLDVGAQIHGIFVASTNAQGNTVLFYSLNYPRSGDIALIADLGKIGDAAQTLTMDLFGFF